MTTPRKHRLLLGAHMSIAGGFEKSIERGLSIHATTIQIFTKSNRQWHAKKITNTESDVFRIATQESGIKPIVAHATYLINIGSPDKEVEKKSIKALTEELERCHMLDIPYLVLHPGAHLNTDEQQCLERIAHNLDIILENDTGKTKILLETMAGQGSTVCYTFEQIAEVRKLAKHKRRIGVCLDTCHIFVAGYDFTTPHTYKAMWHHFDKTIGLNNLDVIHVNDSKKELGSRIDRHEDIGKGKIGLDAFKMLFNDPQFFDTPKILETPKDTPEDDMRNIKTIQKLLSDITKKKLGL